MGLEATEVPRFYRNFYRSVIKDRNHQIIFSNELL